MKRSLRSLSAAMILAATTSVHAQKIMVTYAGTGTANYTSNGGPARVAAIGAPYDVCKDAAGNIYLTDANANMVRKISVRDGVISTVAGGGSSLADGIQGTLASLTVQYLCVDATGNIYVPSGNTVRRVDAVTGVITTVAGNISAGFSGDGGPAINARFYGISGICRDNAGNIYVVDAGNNRIRKIDAVTGIINTVAGSGGMGYTGDGGSALVATLYGATAICVNSAGDLYFSDQSGTRIRGVIAATGAMRAIAGTGNSAFGSGNGGQATNAAIGWVHGIACDNNDNIYVDDDSCACRMINMTTGIIDLVAGDMVNEGYNGDGADATLKWFNFPSGLCVDAGGSVLVADRSNYRIRKAIQLTSTPSFAYGHGQSINACVNSATSLTEQLAITDLDAAQNETWTVVTQPTHGTLNGFPAIAPSGGTASLSTPTSVSYTPAGGYTGADSFLVQVSDGMLSDMVTIYVAVATAAGSITGQSAVCTGSDITLTDNVSGGIWSVDNGNATITQNGVFSGVMPGTITVSYTVAGACNTPTAVITVDGVADAGTIINADQVCAGGTLQCQDPILGGAWSATGNYSSISNAGLLTAGAPGAITINYIVTNTCGTAATSQQVTVVPLPDAGTIIATDEVCKGATINVTDTAAGGVWSVSNGLASVSASGVFTGIDVGNVTLNYTVSNSACGPVVADKQIVVKDCGAAGVAGVSSTAINIYPNPVSSILNIEGAGIASGNSTVMITDVTGRVVLQGVLQGVGTARLNVADLTDGVYTLTITGDDVRYISKVVISRR